MSGDDECDQKVSNILSCGNARCSSSLYPLGKVVREDNDVSSPFVCLWQGAHDVNSHHLEWVCHLNGLQLAPDPFSGLFASTGWACLNPCLNVRVHVVPKEYLFDLV